MSLTLSALCRRIGMSRQNFYQKRRHRQEQEVAKIQVLLLVQRERKLHPRMGARKIHHLISPELEQRKAWMGRDRFFDLLRQEDLLVKRRPRSVKTTQSRHSLPVFRNQLQEMEVKEPNQAWVSDLTYIRTEKGFMYASLITDVYSRKIVGYHVDDSLEAEGCLKALKMATASLPEGVAPLHHSDRGCQYCCHRYVEALNKHKMAVSMTEVNHCYENALAERVNRILKQEYFMNTNFPNKDQARKAMKDAVELYNGKRPHMSLNYDFPSRVHHRGSIIEKIHLNREASSKCR